MTCTERKRSIQGRPGDAPMLQEKDLAKKCAARLNARDSETEHPSAKQCRNGFRRRARYSASISEIVFLCFTGFRRLSGMVRSVGGMPRPRRASRRASLCTLIRSRFFLAMRGVKLSQVLQLRTPAT